MNKKGFTLIELLIAVAIIGVLSGVVMFRGNEARQRARDARRLNDIKQVQIALEASFQNSDSESKQYPANLMQLVTEGFVPTLPVGPQGDAYSYNPTTNASGLRLSYCLGTTLENANSTSVATSDSCNSGTPANNFKVSR